MPVIDFRIRPIYKEYGAGFTEEMIQKFLNAWGYTYQGALKDRRMDSLLKEMKENEVIRGVVPGRLIEGVDNRLLFELQKKYPETFIIFPFLNAAEPDKAIGIIERDVLQGNGKGVSMEPLPLAKKGVPFDDPDLYPIYEKLQENDIPLLVTVSGLMNAYVDNTMPAQIDRMLNDFPKLRLIAAHAGWPWVNEMITVAFKHPNLYLTADFEAAKSPGSNVLREAAEYMLTDQIVFASSFPLGPVAEGISRIRQWNLPKEKEEKLLYQNALHSFGDLWG